MFTTNKIPRVLVFMFAIFQLEHLEDDTIPPLYVKATIEILLDSQTCSPCLNSLGEDVCVIYSTPTFDVLSFLHNDL